MALDAARGLLYVPTSTPSSDYYGGSRPGAGLFAESLLCLDAATGKMKWHFQTVHHGLWDYDNPAQPNLGVTVPESEYAKDYAAALKVPRKMTIFRQFSLNLKGDLHLYPIQTSQVLYHFFHDFTGGFCHHAGIDVFCGMEAVMLQHWRC